VERRRLVPRGTFRDSNIRKVILTNEDGETFEFEGVIGWAAVLGGETKKGRPYTQHLTVNLTFASLDIKPDGP
jgi:hypothetical protein